MHRSDQVVLRVEPRYVDRIRYAAALRGVSSSEQASEGAVLWAEATAILNTATEISAEVWDAIVASSLSEPRAARRLAAAAKATRARPVFERR